MTPDADSVRVRGRTRTPPAPHSQRNGHNGKDYEEVHPPWRARKP
jgi:hypothetical protein